MLQGGRVETFVGLDRAPVSSLAAEIAVVIPVDEFSNSDVRTFSASHRNGSEGQSMDARRY